MPAVSAGSTDRINDLQWGYTVLQGGYSSKATFPIAFSDAEYRIIGCGVVDKTDEYYKSQLTINNIFSPNALLDTRTRNDCLFRSYRESGDPVVTYLAIGV